MRYRLLTLLILLTFFPPLIAGAVRTGSVTELFYAICDAVGVCLLLGLLAVPGIGVVAVMRCTTSLTKRRQ